MQGIKQKLPPLYHRFFPDFTEWQIPEEKWATCNSCKLVKEKTSPYSGTKCCTYHPDLMNYMVGGILQDKNPLMELGQHEMKEKIKKKKGVTPFGILNPVSYQKLKGELQKKKKKATENGTKQEWTHSEANSLRCPYYHDGFCSIWAYREHCCSTHFCISVAGSAGKRFWSVLEDYLIQVENKLSKYTLMQVGFPIEIIPTERINSILFGIEDAKGNIDHQAYQSLWGKWYGREMELYLECYEVICQLTTEDFQSIMGLEGKILEKSLEKHRELFLNPPVPDLLQRNANIEFSPTDNFGFVKIKNLDNGLVMNAPSFVFSILQQFDGSTPTRKILERSGPMGKHYKADFLIPLYKAGILHEKREAQPIT